MLTGRASTWSAPPCRTSRWSRRSGRCAARPRSTGCTSSRACCPARRSPRRGPGRRRVAAAPVRGGAHGARASQRHRARRAGARGPALGRRRRRSTSSPSSRTPIRDGRVLIVATWRRDAVRKDDAMHRLASGLRAAASRSRWSSARSTRTSSRRSSPARATTRCARSWSSRSARAEGNPFFAEELIAAALRDEPELPGLLHDALLADFERLQAPTRAVVRFAAAAGRAVTPAILTAAMAARRGADRRGAARGGGPRAARPRRRARGATGSATPSSPRRHTRRCCRESARRCTSASPGPSPRDARAPASWPSTGSRRGGRRRRSPPRWRPRARPRPCPASRRRSATSSACSTCGITYRARRRWPAWRCPPC